MAEARSGHCLCGAVRFDARLSGHDYGACHCKMCQRWAGAALLAITVPADAIDWHGTEHIARFRSSDWAERAWCTGCGSGLWYRVTLEKGAPHGYEVPIGLFDDPNGLRLAREIFIDRKSDAFALAGDHPVMTEAEVLAMFAPKEGEA